MKGYYVILLSVFLIGLLGCAPEQVATEGGQVSSSMPAQSAPDAVEHVVQPMSDSPDEAVVAVDDSMAEDVGPSVNEVMVTARRWQFEPSVIRVKEGEIVRLLIESQDVDHGFALSEYGINEMLKPGHTVDIEFLADKKGSFRFSCNVFCGSGHGGMTGQLIVE